MPRMGYGVCKPRNPDSLATGPPQGETTRGESRNPLPSMNGGSP